eukprot:15235560-Alexandrium_andersonii.AAC.1
MLKPAIYAYEPYAWRGGLIHHIWKKNEDITDCSSHRAVVLEDSSGKAYHGLGRRGTAGAFA